MTRPLKVFLSHAHADADAVRTLYDHLVADGVDAWLDKEKLIPGQDWEREIRKAVREADVVIVCLSKQFNQRGYRQKEVRWARDEADMIPEGEIFIIPAKLEECENLESLSKIHWVDLFEEDGYEKLMRALELRADKVKASITTTEHQVAQQTPVLSTVVDGTNWDAVGGSTVFHGRLCDAFPGQRGNQRYAGKEACDRLEILLKEPLKVRVSSSGGEVTPIWWFRGSGSLFIREFERLGEERILIDISELHVEYIEAVRSFHFPEKNFVYVQTRADEPTGLYQYERNHIQEYIESQRQKNWGYYYDEEYALWKSHLITREEYDDGAAMIDGKPTRTSNASLRKRFLTPYNMIICGNDHVTNGRYVSYDRDLAKILDDILAGEKTVDDLVHWVGTLPREKPRKNH